MKNCLQIAAALQRICCSSDMSSCVQIALLHNSLFRQFCSCEFRLHFFTIHSSDNFLLLGIQITLLYNTFLQRTLLLWIQIALLHNSFFRQFCSASELHCSWEFCSSETDIKSSMFKSFHRYLLALPTKARILCLDSL